MGPLTFWSPKKQHPFSACANIPTACTPVFRCQVIAALPAPTKLNPHPSRDTCLVGPLPCRRDKEVSEPGVLRTVTQDAAPRRVAAFYDELVSDSESPAPTYFYWQACRRLARCPLFEPSHYPFFLWHGHADALIEASATEQMEKKEHMPHHHLAPAVNSRKQITIME